MRLMTIFELAARPDRELSAMFREASGLLGKTELTAAEKHNAQGSLENLKRVMRSRGMPRP